MGERQLDMLEVGGSKPSPPTKSNGVAPRVCEFHPFGVSGVLPMPARHAVGAKRVDSLYPHELGPHLDDPAELNSPSNASGSRIRRRRITSKARGINKGILALCTRSKPAPSFGFGGRINVNEKLVSANLTVRGRTR